MLQFDVLDKDELVRACELVGVKNQEDKKLRVKPLEKLNREELVNIILYQINNGDIIENVKGLFNKGEQKNESISIDDIRKTLDVFKVKYKKEDNEDVLKKSLYEYNVRKMEEAFEKMSKKKKEKLLRKLEQEITPEKAEVMMKLGKNVGKNGVRIGLSTITVHGLIISVTGVNLGLSFLLVNSLSAVSSLISVTFPFAAYQFAAVAGGNLLGWAAILTNPALIAFLVSANLFLIYSDLSKKKFVKIAGLNYLIESKKLANKIIEEMQQDI